MATTQTPFRHTNSNNSQLDDMLVEQSLSSDCSNNSNNSNVRSILKRPLTDLDKFRHQHQLKQMARMFTIITFIVVYTPIIAFNLYFAFTDNTSCVSRVNPIIGLTLYDYLTIQAYGMTLTLALIVLDDFYDPKIFPRFKTFYNNYILCYRVFSLIWVSIGVIIFVFVTYKRLCSTGIYYYVGAVTSILTFTIIVGIICQYKNNNTNNESKLNENST
jgi:uncharacterized membrane protein